MITPEIEETLKKDAYNLYYLSDEDKDDKEIVKMAMYYKKSSLVYASLRVQHLDDIKAYEHLLRNTVYMSYSTDPKIPSEKFLKEENIANMIHKHDKLLDSMTPGDRFRYYQRYGIIIDEAKAKELFDNKDITLEEYNENKLRITEENLRRTRRI